MSEESTEVSTRTGMESSEEGKLVAQAVARGFPPARHR
jgi:hypothetical protein